MAEAEGTEPGKPPPVASLERALDQVTDFLGRAEQTSRVRALVIEARRLRNIVGNWRSIAPPDDVREEMIARVLRLANDAEEAAGVDVLPANGDSDANATLAARLLPTPGAAALPPPAALVRLPSLQLTIPQPQQTALAPHGRGSGVAVPGPPPGEKAASSWYDASRGDRDSSDGLTQIQATPIIPDLPPAIARAPHGGPVEPSAPPERRNFNRFDATIVSSSIPQHRGSDAGPSAAGRSGGAAPLSPPLAGEPTAVARGPSMQGPRNPLPDPLRAASQLLPDSAFVRGVTRASEMPPRLQPEIIEGPPSLELDREEPPSSRDMENEKTLTGIPITFARQAISVWSMPRPEGLDPEIVMLRDPYSKRADAYRTLRRRIATGSARTIAVTSALPKEGKTICAINLALALAETSPRNVLLVEANIRSPGLAAVLHFDPPTCFTEQLKQHRREPLNPWVVIEQTDPNEERMSLTSGPRGALHLLAIDAKSQRPPMLNAVSFAEGMLSLKLTGYEYIIVDTPPVLGTMDMSVIGDVVDGVILTSLIKKSTRRSLQQAIEQLKPAPVLGVVVLER